MRPSFGSTRVSKSPPISAAIARGAPLAVALAALLCAGDAAAAHHRGHAPKFAGLRSAVTCIPGPGGPERSSSYRLGWNPASDPVTPASKILYEVYQASSAGGENFSKPTYTSAPGVSSFSTPPLPGDERFYFVVRARDGAGREDSNRVERLGQNLCV